MTRIVSGARAYRLLDTSLRPAIRAIGLSLGPDGRAVLYDCGGTGGVGRAVTGFAIAREMPIPCGPQGAAPRLLKETLFAADRDFGDGTARLALIAGECFAAASREVTGHISVQPLCDAIMGLNRDIENLLADELAPQVDLVRIARSAGAAPIMAEELAMLVKELGTDAVIDVRENAMRGLDVTKAQGFVFDAKLLGNEAVSALSSVSVLVADEIIHDFGSLAPVLEGFADKRKSLVIVARDIAGPALATLKRNQRADIVTIAALQPADAGQRAADGLEDLAVATGATLVAERFGTKLERLRPAMLGRAAGFQFATGKATFIKPEGKAEDIAFRMKLLAGAAEKTRYLSYDREHFERRRGRLASQWCELRIAGATRHETEALIIQARAAANAMQSALSNGAIAGGGAVYGKLAARLSDKKGTLVEAAAVRAIAHGLLAIPHQLARNAARSADNLPQAKTPVQDPLCLTQAVINQGVTLAVSLLRTGAVIVR